ncbi:MAG: hypothetical protein IT305_31720 [Chloroflexi bacterium]|nr:hypothetical protein [Chloroflexota bacterium]
METLSVAASDIGERHIGLVVAHAVRNAAGTKFVLRKGDFIEREYVDELRLLGERQLHLVGVGPAELHENEAGARLARAVAGPGIDLRGPSESQYTLLAQYRGLLRVDVDVLFDVNDYDGISVLTRFNNQPVNAGDELAGAKVTPFAMPRATIDAVEAICRERPPLRVLPFQPLRVAAIVLERVDLRARDRFQAALEKKLAWFGSELVAVHESQRGEPYVAAIEDVLGAKPDMIMAAGASSLDPLEPLFGALREIDARIIKHGVPVHPGSLFWVAYVGSTPLFGLSSCEMFSQKTILDLVLPRFCVGEVVTREDLVRLGYGGKLGREMAYRFPPYSESGRRGAADDSEE